MPPSLLDALDERIQAKADEQFAYFLEEFERLYGVWKRYTPREVELRLRTISKPTVGQLLAAAEKLDDPDFVRLIHRYIDLLRSFGMRSDGAGGYHKLYFMDPAQLAAIMGELDATVPGMHRIYRRYTANANAIYSKHLQRRISLYHPQPSSGGLNGND